MADTLRCAFCCRLSSACPLSVPAFILFSSYSISKQIGFYSLLLSISHLLLSISTTVQKQFYYVRLYFYSQLKRLLKYNIACRAPSSSALAGFGVLEREAFWGIRGLLGNQGLYSGPEAYTCLWGPVLATCLIAGTKYSTKVS